LNEVVPLTILGKMHKVNKWCEVNFTLSKCEVKYFTCALIYLPRSMAADTPLDIFFSLRFEEAKPAAVALSRALAQRNVIGRFVEAKSGENLKQVCSLTFFLLTH